MSLPFPTTIIQRVEEAKRQFGIAGTSEAMTKAIAQAIQVAGTDVPVYIEGETGSGKENIARIVHAYSKRKDKKYEAINCGALPDDTLLSELFGAVRGAYTGADTNRTGYFEELNGGTLFMDEVATMSGRAQQALLRVLDYGEFQKMGSPNVHKTNVRLIVATNVNLDELSKSGKFKRDLFYRINTVHIKVPALRERPEDIVPLFNLFMKECSAGQRPVPPRLTPEAASLLSGYYWEGNVRELRSVAQRVCIYCPDNEITPEFLDSQVDSHRKANSPSRSTALMTAGHMASEPLLTNQFAAIIQLLAEMKAETSMKLDQMSGRIDKLCGQRNSDTYTHGDESPQRQWIQHKPDTAGYNAMLPAETKSAASGTIIDTNAEEVPAVDGAPNLSVYDAEKDLVIKALRKHHGNRKAAALDLNISERTLYRKINQWNLQDIDG